jgi:hypothetical protein
MSSQAILIADAVVYALNEGAFSQAFTAARYYVPVKQLEELDTIQISVVPTVQEWVGQSRGTSTLDTYQTDLGVQKYLGLGPMDAAALNAAADPLMDLMQELGRFFMGKPLTGLQGVTCVKVEISPTYSPEHMDKYKTFTGLLTLSFRCASP